MAARSSSWFAAAEHEQPAAAEHGINIALDARDMSDAKPVPNEQQAKRIAEWLAHKIRAKEADSSEFQTKLEKYAGASAAEQRRQETTTAHSAAKPAAEQSAPKQKLVADRGPAAPRW